MLTTATHIANYAKYWLCSILIYIQQDATLHSLFYLETAVHVLGGTITHHQERKQLYLQHLVFVTPLLLSAVIVEGLELVWVCCGWRTGVLTSRLIISSCPCNLTRPFSVSFTRAKPQRLSAYMSKSLWVQTPHVHPAKLFLHPQKDVLTDICSRGHQYSHVIVCRQVRKAVSISQTPAFFVYGIGLINQKSGKRAEILKGITRLRDLCS